MSTQENNRSNLTFKDSTLFKIRGLKNWEKISKAPVFSVGPLWYKTLINQDEMPPRIAFAISKKYGNAVKRNRCKRRIKEVVRSLSTDQKIKKGTWILVGVKHSNREISFEEIQNSCNELYEKINDEYQKNQ